MSKYEELYTYDEPVEINGLFLYPVQMRQYIYFYENIGCLLFNKNRIPDPQIISMSYLAFIYLVAIQNINILSNVENLLYLCFRLDKQEYYIDFNVDKKNKPCINIYKNKTKESWEFSQKDLNKIREIICNQNMVELPNEKIDPKLEAALLETQDFINHQNNNLKIISLEDQMISVLINTSLSWESILNLSIRKFVKILERKNKELHYQIYKTASISGMVEFKQSIPHYLYEDNKDKYEDLITDYEEFKGKMSKVADIQGGK